jgi:hypothetical protein
LFLVASAPPKKGDQHFFWYIFSLLWCMVYGVWLVHLLCDTATGPPLAPYEKLKQELTPNPNYMTEYFKNTPMLYTLQ